MSATFTTPPDGSNEASLAAAAETLRAGGVIVYPTETVYGIGADAFNAAAVNRVQEVKGRTNAKPILVIVRSMDMIRGLVAEVPSAAELLMKHFWPGPLTLVFKAMPGLPQGLTQGSGTIGVRVPSSTLCLRLLDLCACPITSTSANLTGMPVQETVMEISRVLGGAIDLYLDGGALSGGVPSTVVDVSTDHPKILRTGAVSLARLQEIIPFTKSG